MRPARPAGSIPVSFTTGMAERSDVLVNGSEALARGSEAAAFFEALLQKQPKSWNEILEEIGKAAHGDPLSGVTLAREPSFDRSRRPQLLIEF